MSSGGEERAATALPWALAWRLALGQILSWGIFYYVFTVVVGPMHASTGWSRPFLNLGLSIGLLTWGVCAYPVGFWIQRRGARGLMATASLVGAAALALMGATSDAALYLMAWVLLGAAMAGSLYDPAFAVVTRAFGEHYRKGITLITLVGGLASTVFIPLAQFAVDRLGWRIALIVIAAGQAIACTPVHWWGIPRFEQRNPASGGSASSRLTAWWKTFVADISDPRFVGLAVCFAAHSAAFTGIIFQLVPMLQALGVASETIVGAIAVMGPMQVAGRLFLSARGSRFGSLRVGVFSMGTLIASMFVLLALPPAGVWLALFAGMLGLGNGMMTIVRGTSVAELFGRERYAEINGALAAPGILAKAAAPLALAALWSSTGDARSVPLAAAALLVVGLLGVVYVWRQSAGWSSKAGLFERAAAVD